MKTTQDRKKGFENEGKVCREPAQGDTGEMQSEELHGKRNEQSWLFLSVAVLVGYEDSKTVSVKASRNYIVRKW